MHLRDVATKVREKFGSRERATVGDFSIPASEAPRLAAEATSDLAKTFYAHEGRLIHKWVHFFEAYERHFARYRGRPVRMLEIGVFQGGSLEMWREYFGIDAVLFGVDINPDCAARVDAPTQVRIGSQDDPDFLRSVVAEMGGIDIVLDDGSHIGRHQVASFQTLFPLLEEGGLYAIEDLHSSYWGDGYEGGYQRPGTGIEFLKQMIDDMHAPYHDHAPGTVAGADIAAMTFHDSMAFLEKRRAVRPGHIQVGGKPQR